MKTSHKDLTLRKTSHMPLVKTSISLFIFLFFLSVAACAGRDVQIKARGDLTVEAGAGRGFK